VALSDLSQLHILSQSVEFKDLRLKTNERSVFRTINHSPLIKFPIKETITTTAHKVSLMIQAQLSGFEPPNDKDFNLIRRQYSTEKIIVFDRIRRLLLCLIDCKSYDCDAVSTRNALELARSVAAGYWENSPMQLRQIPQVGSAFLRKLVGAGITSVEKLLKKDGAEIERLMSRNPPFGQKILTLLKDFPQFNLASELLPWKAPKAKEAVKVEVKVKIKLANAKVPRWQNASPSVTFIAEVSNGTLAHFWRGSLRKLEKGVEFTFSTMLEDHRDEVTCCVACDEIVGTQQRVVLKHDIPAKIFPEAKQTLSDSTALIEENDEYGSNDLNDEVLLEAMDLVKRVETNNEGDESDESDEEFADIDMLDDIESADDVSKPVKLPNGRWKCRHKCSDGRLVVHGERSCSHRCCKEGVEKPSKKKVCLLIYQAIRTRHDKSVAESRQ
jgi:ATP-dependent DNA helicase HFM1/MER3